MMPRDVISLHREAKAMPWAHCITRGGQRMLCIENEIEHRIRSQGGRQKRLARLNAMASHCSSFAQSTPYHVAVRCLDGVERDAPRLSPKVVFFFCLVSGLSFSQPA